MKKLDAAKKRNGRNERQGKRKLRNRIISAVVSAVILTNSVPFAEMPKLPSFSWLPDITSFLPDRDNDAPNALAAADYENKWNGMTGISIADITDLVAYSYFYQTDEAFAAAHSKDEIVIALGGNGSNTLSEEYMGIGTSDAPFQGTLKLGSSGSYSLQAHRAFFRYLSDKAAIVDGNYNLVTLSLTRLSDVGAGTTAPVLADHVVHDDSVTAAAQWKVEVTGTHTFSGAIGEIGSNAKVDLTFKNSAGRSVVSNAADDVTDAGMFCGKLGDYASLTVSYEGGLAGTDIISANGNAGAFVGTIGDNASLTVISPLTGITPDVSANNGYAGGLVGTASSTSAIHLKASAGAGDSPISSLTIGGTVKGKSGAGGLYGYYTTGASSIDLNDYTVTARSYGQYCGGLFGVLETNGDLTIKNTGNAAKSYTSHSGDWDSTAYYGGVAGGFVTSDLANTTTLSSLAVSPNAADNFVSVGGVFGLVYSAAYIKAQDVTVTAGGQDKGFFGGLVGTTSAERGVFIDLGDFTLTANGYKGGGVVGTFNNGVLRLSGTTTMTNAKPADGAYGQLIGANDNVLTYAASDWEFNRSNGAKCDDLGTWGEVVRNIGETRQNSDAVYFDTTNHTVKLSSAVTSMATANDFIRTALNMQLNNNDSGYDCLLFDSGSGRTSLMAETLSLTNDIDLSGTGITGFMRDGGTPEQIGSFKGKLKAANGTGTHTVTLAVGETYGTGAVNDQTEGMGQIYRHRYNGLFSVLGGTGCEVSDLTVAGTINVRNCVDGMNIGSIAAVNDGDVTLDHVIAGTKNGTTPTLVIKYNEQAAVSGTAASGKNIGGYIGLVGKSGTISISGVSTIEAKLELSGSHESWNCCGGAIGKITADTFTVNIGAKGDPAQKLTNKMTVDMTGITAVGANSDSGGLIGYITKSVSYADRKVNVSNLEFDGCTIGNAATANGGGFLGYAWLNTTAVIDGLTVTSGTINNTAASKTTVNIGVMLYNATGKMDVNELTLTAMTMTGGGTASTGMIVNRAYNDADGDTDGLYLTVKNAGYTLSAAPSSTATVFDEIAAYSASSVVKGGNCAGVVNIDMNTGTGTAVNVADRTVNGSAVTGTGTYTKKLSAKTDTNNNTRYYYNLNHADNTDAGHDLLLWSVYKYAASNIKDEFRSGAGTNTSFGTTFTSTISGTADMTGLSFYPVAKADGCTIGALTLTLDYSGIYQAGTARDPGTAAQHYLMHSGLFLESTAGSKLTISGALSLNGNFLEVGKYSGVLISDTMNGTLTCTSGSVALNVITARTAANAAKNDGYLLINNISRASVDKAVPELKLYNVRQGTYASGTHFKSLIGAAKGSGLKIEFSKIRLEGLKTSSIFSESTLVNSIRTDNEANDKLTYNYTYDDDWGLSGNTDATSFKRNVTYGYEISGSVEYADKETKYSSASTEPRNRFFTHPDSAPTADSSAYSFSSYRKYVYNNNENYSGTAGSDGFYYRELKVNVEASGLTEGCGTYNDPYIIKTAEQLIGVAAFIKAQSDANPKDTLGNVTLPLKVPSSFTSGERWCDNKTSHGEYTATADGFTEPSGGDAWSKDKVCSWLCNAYYMVNTDITLDSRFVGLGGTTANAAWRGVIVGNGTDAGAPAVTITNESEKPFINVANGCVIKDINIKAVKSDGISLEQTNNGCSNAYFGYNHTDSNACKFYGGIIGEIMGGDNIIDNSYVSYKYKETVTTGEGDDAVTTVEDRNMTVTLSGSYGTLVPVGGYVGVVVFGGLIFKNMDARKTTVSSTGLNVIYQKDNNSTAYTYNLADNSGREAWAAIYVNPIVGRVINGYAVNETGGNALNADGEKYHQFSVTEDGHYHDEGRTSGRSGNQHTLKNGTKHYSIADIDPTLNADDNNKLDVTPPASTNDDGTINVPNAQAMFILSLITQSTSGTAQTADGAYQNSLSYGTNGSVYGMSHNADYTNVGSATADTDTDYVTASDDTAANTAVPYIIKYYCTNTNGRCVTSTKGYYDINLSATKVTNSAGKEVPYTYTLPDSFRGLGSVGLYVTSCGDNQAQIDNGKNRNYTADGYKNRQNDKFSIKLDTFDGKSTTIDTDIYLNKYLNDNYLNRLHSGEKGQAIATDSSDFSNQNNDNKQMHGIGLFDSVITKNDNSSFSDFTLSGSVNTQIYDNTYKASGQEVINVETTSGKYVWLSTGGVCGWTANGMWVKFSNVELNDLSIRGATSLGGLLGQSGNKSKTYYIICEECSSENLKLNLAVTTAQANRGGIGAFVGKVKEGGVRVYGTNNGKNNTNLTKYSTVEIASFKTIDKNSVISGGLVGYAGNGCQAYDMHIKSKTGCEVTVGTSNQFAAGGIVGLMQPVEANYEECFAEFINCEVMGINVLASQYAGGFYGGTWNKTNPINGGFSGADDNWTIYKINIQNCKMIGNAASNNTISATNGIAGGFIADAFVIASAGNGSNITIANSRVSNYTIEATGHDNSSAGGFIGYANAKGNNSVVCYIHDSSVENCTLGASGNYAGGAIGEVAQNTENKILGYNIKLDTIKDGTKNGSDSYIGAWIGKATADTPDRVTKIQFAGLAIYGNGFEKNVGNDIKLDNASFVFADYTGQCNGITTNGTAAEGEMSGETYTIDPEERLITRTIETVSGTSKTSQTIKYNYTSNPTTSTTEKPDGWSIDETNGTITQISSGTAYTYTIAVSGLNKGVTVDMPKYPFVNINPQSRLGSGEVLSGDGAVLNPETLPDGFLFEDYPSARTMAAKIYTESKTEGNAKQYYNTFEDDEIHSVTSNNVTKSYTLVDYMKRTKDDDGDRISTFATEQGIDLPSGVDDFAVVVIASSDDNETTNLINRYIQLVTNTPNSGATANFADISQGYHRIDVKKVQLDPETGSFAIVKDTDEETDAAAGISIADNKFKLDIDHADSLDSNTFTLLDIQFLDPLGKNNIAYHLYVPVYTIREMPVNFYASARSGNHSVDHTGTNDYASLFNTDLNYADSLNTWMTQYIRYEYQALDINALLNTGNLSWGYDKTVQFKTITNGDDDDRIPDNAYLTLVNPNGNSDQVYYAKASNMTVYSVTEGGKTKEALEIPLAAFKKINGTTSFAAPYFNKMIAKDIVVANNPGKGKYDLIEENDIQANDIIVYRIDSNGRKLNYKLNTDNTGAVDLSVPDSYTLCEDYYISLYVPKDESNLNKLYHYTIEVPNRLDADAISHEPNAAPNVRSAGVTKQNTCTVLIADLFEQTVKKTVDGAGQSYMRVSKDDEQIKASNKTITVDISVEVKPRNNISIMYLDETNDLFHSFCLTLVRHSKNAVENDIKGLSRSNIIAKYSVDTPVTSQSADCNGVDLNLVSNYLNISTTSDSESKELIGKLKSGSPSFTIYSQIVMDFDEESLADEFPERDSSSRLGVNVEASSNLAYDRTTLAYSSMTEKYLPDNHYYYIETVPSAKLRYTSKKDDSEQYDEIGLYSKNQSTLGVNGRSADEAQRSDMPVNTEAFYNVQSLTDAHTADTLRLTFALKKKTDTNGKIEYVPITQMQNYIDGTITFKSGTATASANATGAYITVDLNAADCDRSSDIYDIVISFDAISGGDFAEYSNYEVDLTAELYKTNASSETKDNIPNSVASDNLIYTNAKINPNIVKDNPGIINAQQGSPTP
uniref:beta strand repeat-containing protein n=1 Tax=Ruminococcus flavefaciens TaxID=1265 RepID=UPI0026EB6B0D